MKKLFPFGYPGQKREFFACIVNCIQSLRKGQQGKMAENERTPLDPAMQDYRQGNNQDTK
jgi:hypothetical protein